MGQFQIAAEVAGYIVVELGAVEPVCLEAVVGRVADNVDLGYHVDDPTAPEIALAGQDEPALDGVIAQAVAVSGPFDVRRERECAVAAVIAPEIDFEPRR